MLSILIFITRYLSSSRGRANGTETFGRNPESRRQIVRPAEAIGGFFARRRGLFQNLIPSRGSRGFGRRLLIISSRQLYRHVGMAPPAERGGPEGRMWSCAIHWQ